MVQEHKGRGARPVAGGSVTGTAAGAEREGVGSGTSAAVEDAAGAGLDTRSASGADGDGAGLQPSLSPSARKRERNRLWMKAQRLRARARVLAERDAPRQLEHVLEADGLDAVCEWMFSLSEPRIAAVILDTMRERGELDPFLAQLADGDDGAARRAVNQVAFGSLAKLHAICNRAMGPKSEHATCGGRGTWHDDCDDCRRELAALRAQYAAAADGLPCPSEVSR